MNIIDLLRYSYRAFSYDRYNKRLMHLIIHIQKHLSDSYSEQINDTGNSLSRYRAFFLKIIKIL
jgi:hypothetical protein